jgi:hypothetical protein
MDLGWSWLFLAIPQNNEKGDKIICLLRGKRLLASGLRVETCTWPRSCDDLLKSSA